MKRILNVQNTCQAVNENWSDCSLGKEKMYLLRTTRKQVEMVLRPTIESMRFSLFNMGGVAFLLISGSVSIVGYL
jgi:hypothetical protein